MTSQEYLRIERAAEHRSIFYQGEMFAMSGARHRHILIAGNVGFRINQAFESRDCQVMQSDMRVKNMRTGSYFYPDLAATCHPPKFEDGELDTLLNPQVIIEVLSGLTESFDRGAKFQDYQRLESLQEYVLVSQKKMLVERYTRQGDATWEYWSSDQPDAVLRLASIDVQIALSDVYAKIEFDDNEPLRVIEEKASY